jgi:Fe-S cluster assembly ATP-binding protein
MTGVGFPQLSATIECADAAHGLGGHIITDGGCTVVGDIAKSFGAGADFVMLGGMLAGHEEYEITDGKVEYLSKDLLEMEIEERACEGIFLAFQYPVELPGVNNTYFLKSALNAQRKYRGEKEIDAMEFIDLIGDKIKLLNLKDSLLKRPVNEGFSGGEKKRNEIFQMAVLEPKLALLDETDSGLDIDALRVVANGVNSMRKEENAIIIVTHYQRLLNYIVPDFVHVLVDGKIINSGDKNLALELEEKGYDRIVEEAKA